jgi:hypothetical protein
MRSNSVPVGTHRRRETRFVLRCTCVGIWQILEHVLCSLLILLLVDNDVGFTEILSLSRVDTGDDLGELFRILVLPDPLATP